MNSDFTLNCPYCGWKNEFINDDWEDELIDDRHISIIPCQSCGIDIPIRTDAVYTLGVDDEALDDIKEDIIKGDKK